MYKNILNRTVLLITVLIISAITACASYPTQSTGNADRTATIHFLDVGQGDSTILSLPSGEIILVDAGGLSAGPRVSRYLKDLGISRIDHLIFTHPHDDHIGGIFSIIKEFNVINIYDNGFSISDSKIYKEYISLIKKGPSIYNILQTGTSLVFGDVSIEVLNPQPPPSGNHNRDSIVMKVNYGNINVFMAGDLGSKGERELLKRSPDLSSRILKVSHHGDSDSTSDDFLKSLSPETAIISVGKANKYQRPHQEVLERLNRAGSRVYRTDINGDIIMKTDGKSYAIITAQ
jgi:competence protein ComEC